MRRFVSSLAAVAILAASSNYGVFAADEQEGTAAVPTRSNANDPSSEVYRASEVIGLPVNDDGGQKIGQIKDLVINGSSREVLYAVVAMNEGKEKDVVYVMPWTAFQLNFNQQQAIQYTVLTVPQNIWLQAPYWPMADWRRAQYSAWAPRVDQYFANHIHVSAKNRNSTFQANKPELQGDRKNPNPAEKRTDNQPKNSNNKPQAGNPLPAEKPNVDPKPAPKPEAPKNNPKPDLKESAAAGDKAPKLPAPKIPDPAEAAKPAPAPREPRPLAPLPK